MKTTIFFSIIFSTNVEKGGNVQTPM